ncbi:hypothetical protein [Methylobacterium sp. Leaf118]|uniref:hypothetical protein n=1 Tax=Methylobacterium sp. Leaf118 TaxID=2876562 RepID=UPI001E2A203B|nr:hypothetical protein [Methylobacterium sp. Leaf118]
MTDKSVEKDDPKAAGFRQDGKGDKAHPENSQEKANERLDEALEETFPSSDPVSVKITK